MINLLTILMKSQKGAEKEPKRSQKKEMKESK